MCAKASCFMSFLLACTSVAQSQVLLERLTRPSPYPEAYVNSIMGGPAVDLNGDGIREILIANAREQVSPGITRPYAFGVMELNERGSYVTASARYGVPYGGNAFDHPWGAEITAVDLDADGDLDIVIPNLDNKWMSNAVGVWRNDGKAGFVRADHLLPIPNRLAWIALAFDANADGHQDLFVSLVTTSSYNDGGKLFLSDGKGNLVDRSLTHLPATLGWALIREGAVADLDRDGDQDVVVVSGNNGVIWLENDGRGRFLAPSKAWPIPVGAHQSLAVADFDGDGALDVAVGVAIGYTFGNAAGNQIFWGDNTGNFVRSDLPTSLQVASAASFPAVLDLEGDGDLDLVFGDGWTRAGPYVYRNEGGRTFTLLQGALEPATQPSTWGLDALDIDGDGDLDLISNPRGAGCWYHLNLTRQCHAPKEPALGQNYEVEFWATQGPRFVFPMMSLGSMRIEIPGVGRSWLDPRYLFPGPMWDCRNGRHFKLQIPIPSDPGLVGGTLTMQGLVLELDPRKPLRFTNAFVDQIGP
jgi:hypothetical protein